MEDSAATVCAQVGQSVNNLAVLLMDQRRVTEALPLLRRAATLARAQLGGKHAGYRRRAHCFHRRPP